MLAKGAVYYGYATDLWTSKRVASLIREEFGVRYSPKRVWSLLRELGLSWQRPKRRAKERDELARYIWLMKTWPDIKKKSEGAILVFLDESGFSSTPYIAKTWAPRGKTPIIRHLFNWEKLSAISAITSRPGLYFRLYKSKSIRKEEVVKFLKLLLHHVRGKVVLLWDGAPQHRAKAVKEFIDAHPRIEAYRLPAYCPELDPDEWVWNYIKRRKLPNLDVKDTSELAAEVRAAFRRIKRRPHLLSSFLMAAELPWDKNMLPNLRGCV